MIAYCLGLGLPFIVLAFALDGARPLLRFVNSHRRAIDLASAAVLVVMGVLLLTNRLSWLSAGLVPLIPSWPPPSLLDISGQVCRTRPFKTPFCYGWNRPN